MRYLTNLLLLSVGLLTVYGGQQRRQRAGGNEDDTDGGGIDRRRFLLSDLDCAQIQSRWRRRQFLIDNQEDILDGGINKRRIFDPDKLVSQLRASADNKVTVKVTSQQMRSCNANTLCKDTVFSVCEFGGGRCHTESQSR